MRSRPGDGCRPEGREEDGHEIQSRALPVGGRHGGLCAESTRVLVPGYTEEEVLASIAVAIREYLDAEIEPDGTSDVCGYVCVVAVAV